MRQRVLAIWLDGFDVELARSLIAEGWLPALAALAASSARFRLDHGVGRATGLAGEHVATGLSPDDAGRWAAVHFDPATYHVTQRGSAITPFAGALPARTVVVDTPYFDMGRAPSVRGLVGWGAHDPGAPVGSRPDGLLEQALARFGAYQAKRWIYGVPWPSAEQADEMGAALTAAAAQRAELARWVLTERLPDWDLAIVTASEPHSVLEGLWHGVDPDHPLHGVDSAGPAAAGVRSTLTAVDQLVADLTTAVPDAAVVVFSLHGMGPNQSDLQSMVLLPELLHRWSTGRPRLTVPDEWTAAPAGIVPFDPQLGWSRTMRDVFDGAATSKAASLYAVARRLGNKARRLQDGRSSAKDGAEGHAVPIRWMPAGWYQDRWPSMRAFALHSFYDGRIRVNLRGREANGVVAPSERDAVLDEIEAVLSDCSDPFSGGPVVRAFERWRPGDGLDVGETEVDAIVTWAGTCSAFDHPTLGRIGPLPFRRAGGHSRVEGMAWVRADGLEAGDGGWRSSFDVVPTLVDLLGAEPLPALSGSSLLATEPVDRG